MKICKTGSNEAIVHCFFQTEDEVTSKGILSVFTAGGLAPSLEIINSTYSGVFHFNLTLFIDQIFWLIDIPRENITKNTDITAVEEWLVRISLHHGLNIYNTEGTLLDIARGIYVGLTFSGFWDYSNTTWYNMTETFYAELEKDITGLSVVDMVLTNHFFIMLTSLGLYVSQDLRYPSNSALKFSRAAFCGFEKADYIKGKLWYSERCFANRESFEADFITITFDRNKTLSEKETFASVNILRNNQPSLRNKFPKFVFPPSFSVPVGMVFHPRSNFLYAYGNQVWISMDGGNTFEFIADFHDDVIKKSYHSFYTSDITFVTQSGKVYLTKAGFKKYSKIGTITDTVFTLYYDHLGFIHKLTPDHFEAGDSQSALGNSKAIFQKFIFFNEIVFFAHVPPDEPPETVYTKEFSNIHLGKMIHSRKSGSAYIEKVLHHRNQEGFFSSVIAKIVDPFAAEEMNESPCINSSFQQSDLQKTVVIPGYSSILITDILNNMNALGIATMPGLSSLAFIMWDASTDCFVTTFVPIMKSSCSYLGAMYHIPREHIPVEHWSSGIHRDPQGFNMIKTLPVNYRPPSTMGIAIPLSDNFYHADPSKPVPRNLFFKSMSTGRFKQCANVSTRAQCNCTQNQKMSHAVAFSDCREKVPRFKFPVKQYPVSLEISSRDGPIPVNLPYLVTVTEVNGRDNWDLKQHTPESIEKLKLYLTDRLKVPVYNPEGLNLTIKGSELFHFKVSVVPGVTFCNLVEEFQIYVDEVPLPFPGHSLIAIAAAITLGGFIFIAFNMKAAAEDEKLQGKINDEDKQKILDKCNEIINWLDKNETAQKEAFEHQQKELEKVCNPIITKLATARTPLRMPCPTPTEGPHAAQRQEGKGSGSRPASRLGLRPRRFHFSAKGHRPNSAPNASSNPDGGAARRPAPSGRGQRQPAGGPPRQDAGDAEPEKPSPEAGPAPLPDGGAELMTSTECDRRTHRPALARRCVLGSARESQAVTGATALPPPPLRALPPPRQARARLARRLRRSEAPGLASVSLNGGANGLPLRLLPGKPRADLLRREPRWRPLWLCEEDGRGGGSGEEEDTFGISERSGGREPSGSLGERYPQRQSPRRRRRQGQVQGRKTWRRRPEAAAARERARGRAAAPGAGQRAAPRVPTAGGGGPRRAVLPRGAAGPDNSAEAPRAEAGGTEL
ncbi:cation channel sperm-associated auxiliary subunit beta [Rhynchocyon petersi]